MVVVGGGLTGIETAAEFAEQGRRVTLVRRRAGAVTGRGGPSFGRQAAGQAGRHGDRGRHGRAVAATAVVLDDGRELPSAVTIWTAGFGVPELAAASGLTTDTMGRLLTDETLTSVDDPRIVAAGDAASPSGQPLRMSCQAALPLGAQAANTVLSRIAGTEPAAVSQAFTGQCISLGRTRAPFSSPTPTTPALPLYVGGRTGRVDQGGGLQGHGVVAAPRGAKPGSYRWFKGGKRAEQPRRGTASRSDDQPGDEHADRFTLLRPLLFTIAYEILGSATEADDVLQDSYLRWADVDLSTVEDTKPTWPSSSPGRRSTRCGRSPAGGRSTSGPGCPSRCCSTRRTPRPTLCSPSRCRWRCWWCWRR